MRIGSRRTEVRFRFPLKGPHVRLIHNSAFYTTYTVGNNKYILIEFGVCVEEEEDEESDDKIEINCVLGERSVEL